MRRPSRLSAFCQESVPLSFLSGTIEQTCQQLALAEGLTDTTEPRFWPIPGQVLSYRIEGGLLYENGQYWLVQADGGSNLTKAPVVTAERDQSLCLSSYVGLYVYTQGWDLTNALLDTHRPGSRSFGASVKELANTVLCAKFCGIHPTHVRHTYTHYAFMLMDYAEAWQNEPVKTLLYRARHFQLATFAGKNASDPDALVLFDHYGQELGWLPAEGPLKSFIFAHDRLPHRREALAMAHVPPSTRTTLHSPAFPWIGTTGGNPPPRPRKTR